MMDERNVYMSMVSSMAVTLVLLQALYTPAIGAWLPRMIELCACYWIIASVSYTHLTLPTILLV